LARDGPRNNAQGRAVLFHDPTSKAAVPQDLTINYPNDYDPDNKTRFTTLEQAKERIQAGLRQFPSHRFVAAELLEEFTAEVVITGSEPAKPDPVPDESAEA